MSPAKMFAYMKERERQKGQQEVFNISSSTRDLIGGTFVVNGKANHLLFLFFFCLSTCSCYRLHAFL